jgi:hypothetical protein
MEDNHNESCRRSHPPAIQSGLLTKNTRFDEASKDAEQIEDSSGDEGISIYSLALEPRVATPIAIPPPPTQPVNSEMPS